MAPGVVRAAEPGPQAVAAPPGPVRSTAIALLIGAHWVDQPLVRAAGFDRAVGHSALATLGVALGALVLHRLGMAPMDGSKAQTLAYGSLIVVGVTIGLGLGVIAVVADRRIFRRTPGGES